MAKRCLRCRIWIADDELWCSSCKKSGVGEKHEAKNGNIDADSSEKEDRECISKL